MKKQPKTPSYAAICEANANHFCDGLNDDSYLSMRFHFAEDAVRKATEDAAICKTSLARLPINNRGDAVSTVAGELFSHLERVECYQYNYDEQISDALYYWIYFVGQFAIPFLQKKQTACAKLGKPNTAEKFGHIIGQLSNMAGTMHKTVKVRRQDPKTYKFFEEKETFTYFYPQVPIFQFRKRAEELFLEEELATKELFTDAPIISEKQLADKLNRIDRNSGIAAAKRIKDLAAARAGGKVSAQNKAGASEVDPLRIKLERWVKDKIREWDRDHPERTVQGYKGYYTNAQVYRDAEKHQANQDAAGHPIYKAYQIKEWFKPSKIARHKGSKH